MTDITIPKGGHAVRAQRIEPRESLDLFLTPPWATRALCEWIAAHSAFTLDRQDVWEPACGLGHMSRPLAEYFGAVYSTDIYDYGYNDATIDFLEAPRAWKRHWVITNPPFNKAEAFAHRALFAADNVALLTRTSFLEGVKRHKTLFCLFPPTHILQFTERVPMHKGRLLAKGSTATSYCWIVWQRHRVINQPLFEWIEPCRKRLEKPEDYA